MKSKQKLYLTRIKNNNDFKILGPKPETMTALVKSKNTDAGLVQVMGAAV